MSAERRWHAGRALDAWLSSRLFARQFVDFVLLWIVFKAGNAYTAHYAGVPLFAFRPGTETAALAFECLALLGFMRRHREDLLLASLGLDLPLVLLPFALVHVSLSLATAALA